MAQNKDTNHAGDILDEALTETFPASDPIAVGWAENPAPAAAPAGLAVALIGISGRVGSRIADELLARGHRVDGIARNLKSIAARPGLALHRADATQAGALMPLIPGHDAVILAVRFADTDGPALIAALKAGAVKRLLVVGGAGGLEVAPGRRLLDAADFPAAFAPEARAAAAFHDELRHEQRLDWSMLSPSAELVPGERTGVFRLGGDQLLADRHGRSWITMEDFAAALVDELEHPRHRRVRFTVGY
jgi:uncharacterized protein